MRKSVRKSVKKAVFKDDLENHEPTASGRKSVLKKSVALDVVEAETSIKSSKRTTKSVLFAVDESEAPKETRRFARTPRSSKSSILEPINDNEENGEVQPQFVLPLDTSKVTLSRGSRSSRKTNSAMVVPSHEEIEESPVTSMPKGT